MSFVSCYQANAFIAPGSHPIDPFPVGSTITIPLPSSASIPLPGIDTATIVQLLDELTGEPTGSFVLPIGTWLYSASIMIDAGPAVFAFPGSFVDTTISVIYDGNVVGGSDNGFGTIVPATGIQSNTLTMPACPIISDGTAILQIQMECNVSAGNPPNWIFNDAGGTCYQSLVRIA